MSWYFYHQLEGQDQWRMELAETRTHVIDNLRPRYSTVLDIDTPISPETERESVLQAHYRGPFYIDIDVSEEFGGPTKAIQQTNKVINKFSEEGVDVRCLKLFASGSKGFHIEVPMQMFLQKANPKGYQRLPMIYKIMVEKFYVDFVDLVVYTGGRGRQWRTPNVQRENGRYKVPITLAELREMTAEDYISFTEAPRTVPEPHPPIYSSALALAFSVAKDKTEDMLKKALKSKLSPKQLEAWQRSTPEPLTRLMNGDGLAPDVGFQKIATQLGIAAIGLGWSCDHLVTRSQGLIKNHVSDSRRYNTESKRTQEIQRMYDYFSVNGAYYELALQPIQSLLEKRGSAKEGEDGSEGETENPPDENLDHELSMRVEYDRFGIYKPSDDFGRIRASGMGIDSVVSLKDVTQGTTLGFSMDIYADGRLKGNRMITIDTFTNRVNLARVSASEASSPLHLTDAQTGGLMWLLEKEARKSNMVKYVLNREGVDIINHPYAEEGKQLDTVYIGGDSARPYISSQLGIDYTIRGVGNDSVTPKSDLFCAPPLKCTPETEAFFDNLFKINTDLNMGRIMGWFSAAFFSQIIRWKWKQFPMLQVYGQAGSGKSKTCELMARMHYYKKAVDVKQASGMTAHALKSRLAGSASIPILLDDMRFNTMDRKERFHMETFMLGSYGGDNSENGVIRRDTGVGHLDIREYKMGAPIVFMSETLVGGSRIIARSVAVPMRMADQRCKTSWDYVYMDSTGILGRLGWMIAQSVATCDKNIIIDATIAFEKKVMESFGAVAKKNGRQAFNVAVILAGLDMMRVVLADPSVGFGIRYTHTIQKLMDAVLDPANEAITKDIDETSRVLDMMAYLSKPEHNDQYRLIHGVDYTLDDTTIDIKLQNAFTKYAMYCRAMGTTPWYSDYPKFLAAVRQYSAVTDRYCLGNRLLKDSARVDVFRFSLDTLAEESVDEFMGHPSR